jgi:2'-5' RNA ligase
MESSLPCDIVLLPNEELKEKAITASVQLKRLGTQFTLGKDGPFPHVSLYQLQLKEADLDKCAYLLKEIAAQFGPFELKVVQYFQKQRYYDAEYLKTPDVENLHAKVIEIFNPIRFGMRERDKQKITEAMGVAKENIQKYGSIGVLKLFRPHMTFTRLIEGQPVPEKLLSEFSQFDGKFDKLALFEMGENGTCIRNIISVDLK